MGRLIDADALDNAFTELRFNADGELAHWGDRKDWCLHGSEVEALIADAPTVDAVPVVRCKDCKWYEIAYLKRDGTADKRHKPSMCMIGAYAKPRKADWFCADGERREDG